MQTVARLQGPVPGYDWNTVGRIATDTSICCTIHPCGFRQVNPASGASAVIAADVISRCILAVSHLHILELWGIVGGGRYFPSNTASAKKRAAQSRR